VSGRTRSPPGALQWVTTLLLDGVTVVLFVVIGRASHHHAEDVGGIAGTLWPFAAGAATGWAALAVLGSRRPRWRGRLAPVSIFGGVVVCVSTVAFGMALRVAANQGTTPAFVGVATAFLGAVMTGWRVALFGVARRLGDARGAVKR
jgi:uncharacterized BrkB/YihY/UPF0761 family membrane protein